MLDVKKLCASAEECLGWPYVSPGTNDARGIDCSGLFVKCYRDQGASIYHGSNTIYRKYCSEKGKLTDASQLKRGMAVFKWNNNTPEKFNDSLGDFQHIGLVVSVNPLRIIHASTGTMCVTADSKIGKWKFWGWLKDVAKEEGGEAPVETVVEKKTAVVTAPSGATVNLRIKPKTSAVLLDRVPVGSQVEILGADGSWSKVKYGGITGYMMSVYLTDNTVTVPVSPGDKTLEDRVASLENRVALLETQSGVG